MKARNVFLLLQLLFPEHTVFVKFFFIFFSTCNNLFSLLTALVSVNYTVLYLIWLFFRPLIHVTTNYNCMLIGN
jgi:hypothetical protein